MDVYELVFDLLQAQKKSRLFIEDCDVALKKNCKQTNYNFVFL